VRFRPRLIDAHGHTARFADGSSLDVTTVVWATGFGPTTPGCASRAWPTAAASPTGAG
jgi:NAD(P)H-nitrite reductase large subunit